MATTLNTINKVLRGMRQFGVLLTVGDTSTTDDYLLMILQFVNEAKEEIEEAGWAWNALRSTVTATLASGTSDYTLTIAGDADVDTTDRTRLLYENVTGSESFMDSTSARPQVFDVTDAAEYRLEEWTLEKMERTHFTDNDETQKPYAFALYTSGGAVKMKVWPTPNAVRTLKLRMYIPQAELSSTSLTATTLTIPARPVYLLATHKANAERGSELGQPDSQLWKEYLDAHGAAVAREQTPADITVGLDR